uniref:Protein kinase domain-containing protein n=1 Tax=Octactis speculum TaxID=3111310 RepID=A0A7S2HEV4_9STRA
MFDDDEDDGTLDKNTLREISILRLLRSDNGHPNIVKIHDVQPPEEGGCGEGRMCMAMPMYQSGDLENLLDGGGIPTKGRAGRKARLGIAHGILSAVAFLHENNVIHRDIKPGNIMIAEGLRPVIIDFSLAKIIDGKMGLVLPPGKTHTGSIGTPTYTAPEVVANQPYGTQSDVWSCGVVLLEVLRGHTMDCEKDRTAIEFVEGAKAALPRQPFADLVRSMLEVDPESRAVCREALSADVFSAVGLEQPPQRRVDFTKALRRQSFGTISDGVRSSGGSDGTKGRAVKTKGKKSGSSLRKVIRDLCAELECPDNSQIEEAAEMYFHVLSNRAGATGGAMELLGNPVLLDCVVLAEKFYAGEERDLEHLHEDAGENYPAFKDWDLEAYRGTEAAVFKGMDYCLYLR